MPGSDDFEDEIAEIRDGVVAPLQTDGLIVATNLVQRVTLTTTTPGRPSGGKPPVTTPTKTEVGNGETIPFAQIEFKEVMRWRNGGLVKVGDVKATISVRALTLEEITSAAWFEIDGVKYTLVEGEIKKKGIDWNVVFVRL